MAQGLGGRIQALEDGLARLTLAAQGQGAQAGPPGGRPAHAGAPAPGGAPSPSFSHDDCGSRRNS
eukprot:11189339-Alexandrium_andersonii.AAC.1